MDNNEIFQQFWQNYVWPEFAPVKYRLYYHDDGSPHCYTVQDLPGQYVEISQEDYARMSHMVRVKDGKLVHIASTAPRQLRPSDHGTPCDPRDVTVIVDSTKPHIAWSLDKYEN